MSPLSPAQQHQIRLRNEYDRIKLIPKNSLFEVCPASGETEPFVSNYLVTYHIPTYVNNGRSMQNETKVRITLPASFPNGKPLVEIVSGQVPFHVNWFTGGAACIGNFWTPDRWVWELIHFVGSLLQFQPSVINVRSPANSDAIPFYRNNKSKFPTDNRPFPAPRKKLVFT